MAVDLRTRLADRHVGEADNRAVDLGHEGAAVRGRHIGRKLFAGAVVLGEAFGVDLDEDVWIERRPVPRGLGEYLGNRTYVAVDCDTYLRRTYDHGQSHPAYARRSTDMVWASSGSVPAGLRNAFLALIENDAVRTPAPGSGPSPGTNLSGRGRALRQSHGVGGRSPASGAGGSQPPVDDGPIQGSK